MNIKKEVSVINNYKITKASDTTIAKIICERFGENIKHFAKYLDDQLRLTDYAKGMAAKVLRDYNGQFVDELHVREGHNLVPLVLRASLASLVAGNTVTPTFQANYCALGSDSTAPTNANVQLGTETIRGLRSNRFSVDNTAYLDKFWSSDEVGGNTYNECGVFVDGTGVANSGYLLSRIIINETMAATETLTINASITFS